MKEFYNTNEDFKIYVDKYRSDRGISLEEALTHKLVKEVYLYYKERVNG